MTPFDRLQALRSQAAYQGLIGLGQGLMANPDPTRPSSFGQSLARGSQGFTQGYQNAMDRGQKDYMQQLQTMVLEQQQRDRESQMQAQSQLFGGYDPSSGVTWNAGRENMSPSEQLAAYARMSPEGYASAQLKKLVPEYKEVNGRLVNVNDPEAVATHNQGQGGSFSGTSMDAQTYNTLMRYNQKIAQGQPTTPQEDMAYTLAYRHATKPILEQIPMPDGTVQTRQRPGIDLSGFARPGGGGMAPPSTGSSPAPSAQPSGGGMGPGVVGVKPDNKALDESRAKNYSFTNLTEAVDDYIADIEQNGIPGPMNAFSGRNLLLEGKYKDILVQMKELYELGAIQGPDMEIVEGVLADPTSIWNKIRYNERDHIEQAKQFKGIIERAQRNHRQTYGSAPGSAGADVPPPPAGFRMVE